MANLKRTATLIFNPYAGFADWEVHINHVAEFWRGRGWTIDIRKTEYPEHATELARAAAAAGHRMVLAAGGDGTLHEAANGIIDTQTMLAPLPAGTTNCLTRDLGLPQPDSGDAHWLVQASRLLLEGAIHRMDVGQCSNGRHFLLWAGVGLDSHIVEHVEPRSALLKRLGFAGYFMKPTPYFLNYVGGAIRVTVDSSTVEGPFVNVIICNSRLYAGGLYNLNPQGALDDGDFEVWAFTGKFPARMFLHSIPIWLGQHDRKDDILLLRGKHVILEPAKPVAFYLDGEINRYTPITCTVLPGALRILTPTRTPAGLFQHAGERMP
ncbi:MAG: diacylglycerol kinase family lipid kinase [Anaerolineales bacterium]|nr:diacylglycerol kinase family lipid kinase [Anaerolineales bacterium]